MIKVNLEDDVSYDVVENIMLINKKNKTIKVYLPNIKSVVIKNSSIYLDVAKWRKIHEQ